MAPTVEEQTFTINGKTYKVNDLIEFSKRYSPIKLEMKHIAKFLETLDLQENWSLKTVSDLAEHYRKIEQSNDNHPIICYFSKDYKTLFGVLDGIHRIIKKYMNEEKYINAIMLTKNELNMFEKLASPVN